MRSDGHLAGVFSAPVLTAKAGRSAPVLANTRHLTRQSTIGDTPEFCGNLACKRGLAPHTPMDPVLWSIGYEKAAWADFIARLRDAGVATVIDVRDLPLSRRPGFSKRTLSAGLAEAGIGYRHLRALGTPPDGREANRRRQWDRFWTIVETRLGTIEAERELQEAAALAAASPSCLLCYEADWHICHRRRVAELLEQRAGFRVVHL